MNNTAKTFMTIGIASAMMMPFGACEKAPRENPLLVESQLPFGAPDFSKIQVTDYLPAFEAAIQQQRDNIQKIVENPEPATFENTILPFEESGRLLDRVGRVFFALAEADAVLFAAQRLVQDVLLLLQGHHFPVLALH